MPDGTAGAGARVTTRSHAVPQPEAIARATHTATFTVGRVIRARSAPMIAPGVPACSRAVNRTPCVTAGGRGTRATPDDAPRPSRRAVSPVPRRDVGALLVLRDARPARALPGPVDASPPRRHRLHQSRAGLVTRRREPPLRMVHRSRLPAPDRRRVDRRPAATHRSMVVGGLLIALGHLVLAVSGIGSLARTDAGMSVFVFGLALIVIGTGHFKPCVSVMVGQLYEPGDARRDGAFTIFYMGINLGAFLSAFVCGTLGERVGWHWGFGSAAVGMLAGLALYVALRERLRSE